MRSGIDRDWARRKTRVEDGGSTFPVVWREDANISSLLPLVVLRLFVYRNHFWPFLFGSLSPEWIAATPSIYSVGLDDDVRTTGEVLRTALG